MLGPGSEMKHAALLVAAAMIATAALAPTTSAAGTSASLDVTDGASLWCEDGGLTGDGKICLDRDYFTCPGPNPLCWNGGPGE